MIFIKILTINQVHERQIYRRPKNRVDLIEIAGKYTQLKKSGKNFTCRSPFRNERTPSFSISQEKQVWYDFGASEGGDVISFIEKAENLAFGEAVEFLAERAGIDVPKGFGENKVTQKEKRYFRPPPNRRQLFRKIFN